MAKNIIEAYGISVDKDLKATPMSFSDQADALKDGTIDVGIFGGGIPQSSISDLNTSKDIVMLTLSDEVIGKLLKDHPAYAIETIRAAPIPT